MNQQTIISTQAFRSYFLTVFLLLICGQSHAEYFGLPSGRSADVSNMADKSIEGGFVTGDIGDVDYQSFGLRFNALVSPGAMVYLDVAQGEIGEQDGNAYGLGIIYQLEGVLQNSDIAVKASFHKAKAKEDERFFEVEGDVLAIEALFSGKNLGTSELRWYANVGMHKFDFEGYDETEIGFGGGIYMPTSFGEFFAGVDLIDEMTFGGGVRYFLQ